MLSNTIPVLFLSLLAAGCASSENVTSIKVSPDEQRLLLQQQTSNGREFRVTDWDRKIITTIPLPFGAELADWLGDSHHLLFYVKPDGIVSKHLFSIDVDDPNRPAVDLTPFPDPFRAGLLTSAGKDGSVLVEMNLGNNASVFSLYRLFLDGRAAQLVDQGSPQSQGWLTDPNGALVARLVAEGHPARIHLELRIADDEWKKAMTLSERTVLYGGTFFELLSAQMPDGTAWVIAQGKLGNRHVQRIELTTGRTVTDEATDPPGDVWTALTEIDGTKPLLYIYGWDDPKLRLFDHQLELLFQQLLLPINAKPFDVSTGKMHRHLAVAFRTEVGEQKNCFGRSRSE